jgi:hypothetical protein
MVYNNLNLLLYKKELKYTPGINWLDVWREVNLRRKIRAFH